MYPVNCGFACYANCTLNLPQAMTDFSFEFFFLPNTHICKYLEKVASMHLRNIQIHSCVITDSMQIKLPILSDVHICICIIITIVNVLPKCLTQMHKHNTDVYRK